MKGEKMPRIRIKNETNSGRRVGWTKHVTGVDVSKTNGYAFSGSFLNDGKEYDLPTGSLIISVQPEGSVKHGWKSAALFQVGSNGELTEIDKGYDWYQNFLSFRDLVAEHFGEIDKFSDFSDEEILAEAKKRGLV